MVMLFNAFHIFVQIGLAIFLYQPQCLTIDHVRAIAMTVMIQNMHATQLDVWNGLD